MSDTAIPDEWEQVKTEWDKTKQFGYQAVIQAAKVGQMLINLKGDTKPGKFQEKVKRAALPFEYRTAANLMKLADNLPLLEEQKPESQREALKLIREATGNPASVPTPKIVLRLKQADFDLIRECLEAKGIPDELQDRFEQALKIINQRKPV